VQPASFSTFYCMWRSKMKVTPVSVAYPRWLNHGFHIRILLQNFETAIRTFLKSCVKFSAVLWIRTHFFRIRIHNFFFGFGYGFGTLD
jgi:hypothetical protein